MRIVLIFAVVGLFTGFPVRSTERGSIDDARVAADPIERLVTILSASPPFSWQNGHIPTLDLPVTASMDEVVVRFFQMISFNDGRVTDYCILESREVRIKSGVVRPWVDQEQLLQLYPANSRPDRHTAVLVDTNLGRKIVLLKHEGSRLGWWSRVYDAD